MVAVVFSPPWMCPWVKNKRGPTSVVTCGKGGLAIVATLNQQPT